jgi:hypothetical protein
MAKVNSLEAIAAELVQLPLPPFAESLRLDISFDQ